MPEESSDKMQKTERKISPLIWVVLHIMLALYSLCAVFMKLAAQEEFLSLKFCIFYGLLLLLLAVYAIGWQQIIKRMPLTAAFANKAVSVIWACIFGALIFGEKITWGKIISGVLAISGVVLFALSDAETTASVNEPKDDKITGDTNETEKGGDA